MILNIVCDISGSMGEGGKLFAMRTAVVTIAQWPQLGYADVDIRLCGWASQIRHFPEWSAKDEYPAELLSCEGPLQVEALIQWLSPTPDGKVLLFTDGSWTREGTRTLTEWRECLPQDTLRVIKIGVDANPQLKGPNVFASEDLFVALDGWLKGGVA
jgi:hypothetical protein